AALLGGLVVPADLVRGAPDDAVRYAEEVGAGRGDGDDLVVLDQRDAAGRADERGGRRREERLAVADADEERAVTACADEQAGVRLVDDDEREVPLEVRVRTLDGLDEVAVVRALDQVRDDLRVGLGAELVPGVLELVLELAVVLDDAVEDDRDAVIAAREGVRVRLADAAVRRPARVPEARRRRRAVVARGAAEEREVADRVHVLEPGSLEQRDPGRVVAAILESFQPSEQELLTGPLADVSDDSAHA